MSTHIGSDAERLQAIQDLERAIAGKQPALKAARAERDATKQRETEARRALSATDARVKSVGTQVHLTSGAVYLNGDSLDRGKLELGNQLLKFSGWHGKLDLQLATVAAIEPGTSELPPRVGIPVLSRIWPGRPRLGDTLVLTVKAGAKASPDLPLLLICAAARRGASRSGHARKALEMWPANSPTSAPNARKAKRGSPRRLWRGRSQ